MWKDEKEKNYVYKSPQVMKNKTLIEKLDAEI